MYKPPGYFFFWDNLSKYQLTKYTLKFIQIGNIGVINMSIVTLFWPTYNMSQVNLIKLALKLFCAKTLGILYIFYKKEFTELPT